MSLTTLTPPAAWPADLAAPSRESLLLDGAIVRFAADSDVAFGAARHDLTAHEQRWGNRHAREISSARLPEMIERAGLTGRGGAHFPVVRKWRSTLDAGPGGTLVVNAAEGEPAAAKDATLMQLRPHLVLDGAMDVAELIGAREVVIWLDGAAGASLASLRLALAERFDRLPVRILTGSGRYVEGESSAVIRAVSGGPALPLTVHDPARPWNTGPRAEGPPVLVHNAETLARVAAIGRLGTRYEGTGVMTVSTTSSPGRIDHRTVVEAVAGESLADVVWRSGHTEPSAVLVGGYGGQWRRWSDVADLAADPDAMRAAGTSYGAGILLLVPHTEAVLGEASAIAWYLADESAQQCGPCMFGLPAVAEALQEVAQTQQTARASSSRRRGEAAQRLEALLRLVEKRGACRHPDGAVRMIRSAVDLTSDGSFA